MPDFFKIINSPNSEHFAAISFEGDVYFADSKKDEIIKTIDFNTWIEPSEGPKFKNENTVLSLDFCHDFNQANPKKFEARKFKKKSVIMCLNNNRQFCEYLLLDDCKIMQKTLETGWEQLKILQNHT